MNILVTGKGTSGSWAIRGEQLGAAIGATVIPQARDVAAFDAVVMVKRPEWGVIDRARAAGVPLVWDVVDSWPQPAGNLWDRDACMGWLRQGVATIKPAAIVTATRAMAQDCEEFGIPLLALPHHAWPDQGETVIAEQVRRVGYQGGVGYLGRWDGFMHQECARRGWQWVVNPPSIAALDIVVAVRHQDGYAPRAWKSNVKLANAQGCGTPFIGARESGYQETAAGAEHWADTEREMVAALDALAPREVRERASIAMKAAAPQLDKVAATYKDWLCRTVGKS